MKGTPVIGPQAKPAPSRVDLEPCARRIEKPWGWEVIWAEGHGYTGKLLHARAGQRLSLQYHDEKVETQCLISGRALLLLEDEDGGLREILMEAGSGYTIHPYQLHRLTAIEDTEVFEVSTPETGTTVRVADDFQREDETAEVRTRTDRGRVSPAVASDA